MEGGVNMKNYYAEGSTLLYDAMEHRVINACEQGHATKGEVQEAHDLWDAAWYLADAYAKAWMRDNA